MSRFRTPTWRRRLALSATLLTGLGTSLVPAISEAFCGFYVAGADAKLFNNATVVVLMREGKRTVLSMQNDYQGPPEDFALVIPVPVVLHESDVKVLRAELFDRVETLASPRLVEYWEQDPCPDPLAEGTIGLGNMGLIGKGGGGGTGSGYGRGAIPTVVVEAEFTVGEYDIVILSATESTGLDTWLRDNHYNVPAGAEPLLRSYVEQGSKFFVAKVDPAKVRFDGQGHAMLSPLRFHYDSDEFSLPVRLGLINAPDPTSGGKQDLLVHILAKNTRYQVANYPNATIPTNLDVEAAAREQFGAFYVSLFDHTVAERPNAVVTEYSWGASNCDPCPGPAAALTEKELLELGADVIDGQHAVAVAPTPSTTTNTTPSPMVRQAKAEVTGPLDRDIIRRIVRAHINELRSCYAGGLVRDPNLSGRVTINFVIGASGKVAASEVFEPRLTDKSVEQCIAKAVKRWTFPKPQGGGEVTVKYPFNLSPGTPNTGGFGGGGGGFGRGFGRAPSPFVLTRLHARYDSSSLTEDLVFEVAEAIAGGRESRDEQNELEHGAQPSGINNFQARYAIRHPWVGAIECEQPQRGIWGGPWPDQDHEGGTAPIVAKQLATAPRGASLASFVSAGSRSQLGLVAPVPTSEAASPEPSAADGQPSESSKPSAEPSKTGPAGCSCSSQATPERPAGPLLMLLALVGLGARRRT